MTEKKLRVLIPFNTVSLYGMERGVIETFDLLRPEVEPHFLLSYTTLQLGLPVLAEIQRRGLRHSFFSDTAGWPKIGRPRSLREGWRMMIAMLRGNRDVFMAALGKDLIYIPSIAYFYFAICAAILYRLKRRRIIYHFHDLLDIPSRALRTTGVFVTDFVHNTQFGRAQVARANPYVEKKRNWVIPLKVSSPPNTARDGKQEVDFEAKRNVLFMGRASLDKGVDILLDAFEALAKSHEDLILNIVGGCDDLILRQRLENGMSGNGCEVKWWGYQNDVGPFLGEADLYVQPTPPSRCLESFGIGLLEAMSFGIPSVCFRSGAFQEIMIHEETGLICEDEQPQALAESIDRLLGDIDLRTYCGQQALKRYHENYSSVQIKACWLSALGKSQ
jgi:glycosyltransferase involved in cell wall biosynthesis